MINFIKVLLCFGLFVTTVCNVAAQYYDQGYYPGPFPQYSDPYQDNQGQYQSEYSDPIIVPLPNQDYPGQYPNPNHDYQNPRRACDIKDCQVACCPFQADCLNNFCSCSKLQLAPEGVCKIGPLNGPDRPCNENELAQCYYKCLAKTRETGVVYRISCKIANRVYLCECQDPNTSSKG